jgi:hypothetical protein
LGLTVYVWVGIYFPSVMYRRIFIAVLERILRVHYVIHIAKCPLHFVVPKKNESKGKIEHAFFFLSILKGW